MSYFDYLCTTFIFFYCKPNMASSLLKNLQRYKEWLFEGNVKNPLDRLRFYSYIVCTVVTIVGCVLHFLGIMGFKRPTLLSITLSWCLLAALILALFLTKTITLRKAFTTMVETSQVIESARIIYLAYSGTMLTQQFYINEFICFAILLVVILGFFHKQAIFLTVINLLTIAVCRYYYPTLVNSMTISFFILADIALCTYCFASVKFVKQITMENDEVKGKYNSFLSFMRMNDAEATSLIQLVRTAFDDDKHIDMLVGQLSDETKNNLVNVARRIHDSKIAQDERIKKRFPQLSPTEVTVCILVISGHTQKDIARIMDKTENNISTVRGNIRRKLNLETSQDLREYLSEELR